MLQVREIKIIVLIIFASVFSIMMVHAAQAPVASEIIPEVIIFEFEGESEFTINLDEEIPVPIINVFVDGELSDREYEVIGEVDNTYPGIYEVKYVLGNLELISVVTVIDNISPVLKLKGNNRIVLIEGERYAEPGFTAVDNIDGDITEKVTIRGEVGTAVGTYRLTYSVRDASGNSASVRRTVVVNRRLVPQLKPPEPRESSPRSVVNVRNEITDMSFSSTGINITSRYNENVNSFSLINVNTDAVTNYSVTGNHPTYRATLNLTNLPNGTYDLYVNQGEEQNKVVNNINFFHRIGRAKIGNRLVTLDYRNDNVRIIIEPHAYQWDILIDVGHGGGDPGAVNSHIREKDLNLEVSLYERDRYIEYGLSVLMTRTTDATGFGLGPWTNGELIRRVYGMGHHGVVSRFVYSNHHNAHSSSSVRGFEIIVPASLTRTELAEEHAVRNAWNRIFPSPGRMYTRNFDTGGIFNKINGEVYNFNNWYAVNRVPWNMFRVKATIYEPIFMSNPSEFSWYYRDGNWKRIAEAKIRVYVEALGRTYIPPSS